MRFAGTRRNTYTKEKVRELRLNNLKRKPKVKGVPEKVFQQRIGDLQAAGHLKINGFVGMNTQQQTYPNPDIIQNRHTIEFMNYTGKELGEAPHFLGYLESASNADKSTYRIKGWFNTDGTMRIELVN